jgi:hypothetical protein
MHSMANNTGGAKSTMGIKSHVKESSHKEQEDWFEPALNTNTPLSPLSTHFFHLHLFNSVAKKIFLGGEKYLVGHSTPLPPPLRYTNSLESDNRWHSQQSCIETGISNFNCTYHGYTVHRIFQKCKPTNSQRFLYTSQLINTGMINYLPYKEPIHLNSDA